MKTQTFEQTINYSVNTVKNALNNLFENHKCDFLNVKENSVFNTYSFDKILCAYNVSLKEVDENSTSITVTCSDRSNDNTAYQALDATITRYINEFLNILAAQLENKHAEEIQNLINANKGQENIAVGTEIITTIFAIISIIVAVSIFI